MGQLLAGTAQGEDPPRTTLGGGRPWGTTSPPQGEDPPGTTTVTTTQTLMQTTTVTKTSPGKVTPPRPSPELGRSDVAYPPAAADVHTYRFGPGPIGLGLKDTSDGCSVFVSSVFPSTQADLAGVPVLSAVLEVNGEPLGARRTHELRELLQRRSESSPLLLKLRHPPRGGKVGAEAWPQQPSTHLAQAAMVRVPQAEALPPPATPVQASTDGGAPPQWLAASSVRSASACTAAPVVDDSALTAECERYLQYLDSCVRLARPPADEVVEMGRPLGQGPSTLAAQIRDLEARLGLPPRILQVPTMRTSLVDAPPSRPARPSVAGSVIWDR